MLRLESVENDVVSVVSVLEGAIDSAYGRGAGTRLGNDAVVDAVLVEELCYVESLREGFELDARAEVVEEFVAVID